MIREHADRDVTTTAVTITRGAVGGHVGLRYSARGGARHLHLAFHHQLCDEDWAQARVKWITPGFSDPLGTVRSVAALVANRYADDGEVPYAFRPADAAMDAVTGELRLNASLGLTCSTFVLRLFSAAGVALLDEASWDTARTPERSAADTLAQEKLVEFLRPRDPSHAEAVAKEIGCTRIRAEEVAAASASTTSVAFGDVVEFAAALLAEL